MRVLTDATDRSSRRRRLDRAWQRFLQGGELSDVRPEIARSWTRARDVHRIDPGLRRAPLSPEVREALPRLREQDETFELARPLLAKLSARLEDAGHVLSYFDGDGLMLSIGGDPATIAQVAEINLCPGARWREDVAGTNGTGTALVDGRPIEVFASEHFVEAWQPWTSAAAPVLAPGSGELVAVVQITGPWDSREPQGLVAAAALATAVEERLRARQEVRDELVRHTMRSARSTGEAVVAIDARGRVLEASDAARRRLWFEGGELPLAVRERLVVAMRERGTGDEELLVEWPGAGDERRRVACATVLHERRVVGAILHLAPPPAARVRGARQRLTARYGFEAILGRSERLRAALDLAEIAARNDLPVILHGESGTGKELFAQGIHAAGARGGAPFVALNCGAIPAALVESELFGYEPGTFTGAQREGKAGKFEEADGGTLFLDEVSELPPQAQTALLRVLQESEVVRLGGSAPRPVDVRVIAATNRRLWDQVDAGRFRQDLYFRVNVLHVDIPPLRARSEDVPLLARAFLREAEERMGRAGLVLSDAALAALVAHPWLGNVRELKNVMMRAAAVVTTPAIEPVHLRLAPVRVGAPARSDAAPAAHERQPEPPAVDSRQSERPPLDERGADPRAAQEADGPERDELVAALDACGWNIARTATSLGVSRMTLYRRLRKFGITR